MPKDDWYHLHTNLAMLAQWMFNHDWDQTEVVRMLARPWAYEDQWTEYQAYEAGRLAAARDRIEMDRITTTV